MKISSLQKAIFLIAHFQFIAAQIDHHCTLNQSLSLILVFKYVYSFKLMLTNLLCKIEETRKTLLYEKRKGQTAVHKIMRMVNLVAY